MSKKESGGWYREEFPTLREISSAAVLAGGEGSRLGMSKALVNIGEKNLLLSILERLSDAFREVLLVTRGAATSEEEEVFRRAGKMRGVRIVSDLFPGRGPLAGIHASLHYAASPLVFVTACDMPFISLPLARALLERARDREAAVPRIGGYLEPLFAVYASRVAPKARDFLERGVLQVSRFIESLDVYFMEEEEIFLYDPDKLSFRNINSREDLETVLQVWKTRNWGPAASSIPDDRQGQRRRFL